MVGQIINKAGQTEFGQSILKKVIQELPDDYVVPAQSAYNTLKKKGVTDEELEFSGVLDSLPSEGKLSKKDFLAAEEARKDLPAMGLKTMQGDQWHRQATHDPDVPNWERQTNIYTYATPDNYRSSHYTNVPNYAVHTRSMLKEIDGIPTRVVEEVQSDLHAQARAAGGYGTRAFSNEVYKAVDELKDLTKRMEEAFAEEGNYPEDLVRQQEDLVSIITHNSEFDADTVHSMINEGLDPDDYIDVRMPPKVPHQKTWARKTLERELDQSLARGEKQFAVPIRGTKVAGLNRGTGVQDWYENHIASALRKIAKQRGFDFELKSEGLKGVGAGDDQLAANAKNVAAKIEEYIDAEEAWESAPRGRESDYEMEDMRRAKEDLYALIDEYELEIDDENLYELDASDIHNMLTEKKAYQVAEALKSARNRRMPEQDEATRRTADAEERALKAAYNLNENDVADILSKPANGTNLGFVQLIKNIGGEQFVKNQLDSIWPDKIPTEIKYLQYHSWHVNTDLSSEEIARKFFEQLDGGERFIEQAKTIVDNPAYPSIRSEDDAIEYVATELYLKGKEKLFQTRALTGKEIYDGDMYNAYDIAKKKGISVAEVLAEPEPAMEYAVIKPKYKKSAIKEGYSTDEILSTYEQISEYGKQASELFPKVIDAEQEASLTKPFSSERSMLTKKANKLRAQMEELDAKEAELESNLLTKYGFDMPLDDVVHRIENGATLDDIAKKHVVPDTDFQTKLYSAGAPSTLAAYIGWKAMSDEEKKSEKLKYYKEAKTDGLSKEATDADWQEQMKIFDAIDKSKEAGESDDQILARLEKLYPSDAKEEVEQTPSEIAPTTLAPASEDIPAAPPTPEEEAAIAQLPEPDKAALEFTSKDYATLQDLIADGQVLYPLATVSTRFNVLAGDKRSAERAQAAADHAAVQIEKLAAKHGFQIRRAKEGEGTSGLFGHSWEVADPSKGEWRPLYKENMDGLLAQIGDYLQANPAETLGLTAGGIGGAYAAGKAYERTVGPAVRSHPLGLRVDKPLKGLTMLAGGALAAGTAGAITTNVDYLTSAIQLQEELDSEAAIQRMIIAAEEGVYGELIGGPVMWGIVKSIKGIYGAQKRATKATVDAIVRVKDFLIDGNTAGARRFLKESFFLTDEELDQVVKDIEKAGVELPGKVRAEREIAAYVSSQPGGEAVAKEASKLSFQASQAISRTVDTRSKEITSLADELAGENAAKFVTEDLSDFITNVDEMVRAVKKAPYESPRASEWGFDMNALAIRPLANDMYKTIDNVDLQTKYRRLMESTYKSTSGRHLGDLVELRSMLTTMQRGSKFKVTDQYKQILRNIDNAIEDGAKATMDNPDQWLDSWRKSNIAEAQLFATKNNALFKALTKPGINPDAVANALIKHGPDLDDTMHQVMMKLPPKTRQAAEGLILQKLAHKWTIGAPGEMNATHFPALAESLKNYRFTTPEARRYTNAINQLASVFKNDVKLAAQTGNLSVPAFQSYLTTDPVVRAKFALASKIFSWFQSRIPGTKTTNEAALIRKTAELLENPLDAKTAKQLMEETVDIVDIEDDYLKLAQQVAQQKLREGEAQAPRLKFVTRGDSKIGRLMNRQDLVGTKESTTSIPQNRIATTEIIEDLMRQYGLNRGDKMLDDILRDQGYQAIQLGSEKVRIL